jgi:hypothetical protein
MPARPDADARELTSTLVRLLARQAAREHWASAHASAEGARDEE